MVCLSTLKASRDGALDAMGVVFVLALDVLTPQCSLVDF